MLGMATIFLFHSNRAFDPQHWHINNNVSNLGSDVFIQFCNMWMMPFFFVISGAAIFQALKVRSGGAFAWERFLRVLVPVLIVGYWILSPLQVYLERLGDGEFIGSFFQFYAHIFQGGTYEFDGGNFSVFGIHLWYLVLLFTFSLLLLPLC